MTDVKQLITEHLDIWLTAETEKKSGRGRSSGSSDTIYGVQKLRNLIVNLATNGKLDTHNVNENAVRLDSLNLDFSSKNKYKKTKDAKVTPPHKNWITASLGEVIKISSGDGLTAKQMNQEGKIPVYGGNGITGYHDHYNVCKPTLVIGRVGYYCGSIHITQDQAWVTDNAFITQFSEECFTISYLDLLLKSIDLQENSSATAQPVISGSKIYPLVILIPPLEEQHRIVEKVDELMQLCDQLEQQQTLSSDAHATLVDTLLKALTESSDADEFQDNWQRIVANFDVLFTTEYSIEQLKQTVLQLAVMGKLVKQDPSDEPASELLKKIAYEKAKLIKEGKIKKSKPLPEITEDEKPFELPSGWEWVRLDALTSKIGAGSTPKGGKEVYKEQGIPFLRSQNVWNEGLELSDVAFIEEATHEKMSGTKVQANDLLFNITGGSIGRCAHVSSDFDTANVSQHVTIVRCVEESLVPYLHLVLRSSYIQDLVMSVQVGVSREGLSISKLSQFVIPLPPLDEQQKIITKAKEIRQIIQELNSYLSKLQKTKLHLADALVANAVEGV
jgi:type I restriction enzyme S subunit